MEDQAKDQRTVFVRGVSFATDEKALEDAFTDIGPVRSCFLVRNRGETKHKGFGFVQFAIPEDAERAVKELNGKVVAGRKLQVESATKRAPLEQRKKRKLQQDDPAAPAASPPPAQQQEASPAKRQKLPKPKPAAPTPAADASGSAAHQQEKHKAMRTVAIGNLTPETIPAAVSLAYKCGQVVELQNPAPADAVHKAKLALDGCEGSVVLVVYDTVKAAVEAITKLHGQKVRPPKKGAGKAPAADDAAPEVTLWARQLVGEGALVKRWRLILRNLPFKVTEDALRKVLAPAGFLWELKVPRGPDGRAQGFGFAAFTCKAHAERAIQVANGKLVMGRPVAVDWAVAKAQYTSAQKAAGAQDDKHEDAAAAGSNDGDEADEQHHSGSEQPSDDGSQSDGGSEDEDAGSDASESDGGSAGDEQQERDQEQQMLHSVMGEVMQGEDSSEQEASSGSGDEEGEEDEAPEEQQQGSQQQGSQQQADSTISNTVFIRGLALDTSSIELQLKMEAYGPVHSCRLVMNKTTGKPKGTAFVEFKSAASAQRAAAACAKARKGQGPEVSVKGRVLDVDLAVGQDQARSLAAQGADRKSGQTDRRHLYLAKEGHIAEGSEAWEGMSLQDRQRRKRAAEEKKLKLRSPNFFVSTTRLSVRNIPYAMTDKQLRQLFLQAVKDKAVKERPAIKQVKILREAEKVGPDGQPLSKGLGFVEFEKHEHAIVALRQMNNNPVVFTRERRPIVEFAIENAKVVKAREAKVGRQRERQQQEQQRPQQQQQRAKQQPPAAAGEGPAAAPAAAAAAAAAGGVSSGQVVSSSGKAVSARQLRRMERLREKRKERKAGKQQQQQQQGGGGDAAAVPKQQQQRKQQQAAKAAPAAAARASPRAGRQQQDAARVSSAQQRKRQLDEQIDRLAQEGSEAVGGGSKGRQGKRQRHEEGTDKLDKLVAQYKSKLFGAAAGAAAGGGGKKAGGGKGAGKGKGGGDAAAGLKRWFE